MPWRETERRFGRALGRLEDRAGVAVIHIFHGPDQFRAREELAALRKTLARDGNLVHNTQRLEGKSLSHADLRAACHAAEKVYAATE